MPGEEFVFPRVAVWHRPQTKDGAGECRLITDFTASGLNKCCIIPPTVLAAAERVLVARVNGARMGTCDATAMCLPFILNRLNIADASLGSILKTVQV